MQIVTVERKINYLGGWGSMRHSASGDGEDLNGGKEQVLQIRGPANARP